MPLLPDSSPFSGPSSYLDLLNVLAPKDEESKREKTESELDSLLSEVNAANLPAPLHSMQTALLLTFKARIYFAQKKLTECSSALKTAEALISTLTDCPSSLRLAWLLERARLSVGERTPSQARIAYGEAWNVAIAEDNREAAIEIAEMMAEIEPSKTRITWIEKGIELAEGLQTRASRKKLAGLLREQGLEHQERRKFDEAIAAFEKSARVAREAAELKLERLAMSAKGKVLRIMQKATEALELQMLLLKQADEAGVRNAEIYEEVAECLAALKRPTEAESYYAMAFHEYSADPSPDDRRPQALKRLKALGKVRGV